MIGERSIMKIDGNIKVGVDSSRKVEFDKIKITRVEIAKIENQTAN